MASALPHRLATLAIAMLLSVASLWGASPTTDPYPMRWRIFCDPISGTSFRFPYDYRIPDQYKGELVRPGSGGNLTSIVIDPKTAKDPKAVEALIRSMRTVDASKVSIRHRWVTKADLPGTVDGADLNAVLTHLAGEAFTSSEPFDYYSKVEQRGHADPTWAPAGLTALRATKKDACAQIIALSTGYAALILQGELTEHDNSAILDSFEVLAEDKKGVRATWREAQTTKHKKVFTADGKTVPFAKSNPVSWDQAWECETANYHITCSASPLTTASVGALMEALYATFSDVYQPEVMPPYKMEIHIQPNVTEFARIANAKGFGPVETGTRGSLTGGFFVPSQLCIYSFEEPVKGYPTRMDKTLAHEASHQFLHVTCNGSDHVPTWINEGLAVYFESGEFKGGRIAWKPPAERMQLLTASYAREKKTLLPLEDYFDHHGHIPAACYGEVYALTHFWVFGAKGGRERFHAFWKALKNGEDGNTAFERIFMVDMIAAQGGRPQALQAMSGSLLEYVKKGGPMKLPVK